MPSCAGTTKETPRPAAERRNDPVENPNLKAELQCRIYPLNTLENYKYVVVCTFCRGQWILSRHRQRSTWETQGGHIEPGELPIDAARRELFEESGISDAELIPVCDYFGYNPRSSSTGVVFLALANAIGTLPESEMKEIRSFDVLPDALTYPHVTPVLIREAARLLPEDQPDN